MRLSLLFLAGLGFLSPIGSGAAEATIDGWPIPQPGHVFSFPFDHGSHPRFRIEWWYVTGHLYSVEGRRFGFQATFFRAAGPWSPAADADFGTDQLFLAHMALTDPSDGRFLEAERLNREGWNAGAAVGHLDLRNGEWTLRQSPEPGSPIELAGGVRAEASFTLSLVPEKPLVVFGDNGVSRKGAEPEAASYYLTFPRLEAKGRLELGGRSFIVNGEAWMDHEISSSQLGRDQVGWDWTCIQFKDSRRELMLYRLRRADGTADPSSRLQWVGPDGHVVTEPFTWEVMSQWKNPGDGVEYPSRVRLGTVDPKTGDHASFEIVPILAGQVLTNGFAGGSYWEGACRVLGADGAEVGSSYLELTGYAKPLKL
jgi:predicted secreted hydrolase